MDDLSSWEREELRTELKEAVEELVAAVNNLARKLG